MLDELSRVKAEFEAELNLLKQEREKTKKLQEKLIQSRKMQEKINQEYTKRLDNKNSSANLLPPPMPKGNIINKWAELNSSFDLYKNPEKTKANRIDVIISSSRVLVLEKLGGWHRIKKEKGSIVWIYTRGSLNPFSWFD